MYRFLNKNNYIENSIQKEFVPGMTGTFEHTAHLAQMIKQAKLKQRSIVVTLLDLKNAFGEVHHNIIPVALEHHHVPEEIVNIVKSLYVQFHTTVTTSRFSTEFLPVSKGVLQGDCLSPLLFNLLFNTLIQYIKSDKFQQMGYSFSKLFAPRHWYQFADDAAVLTGQEYENQILLNAFTAWCTWCNMIIRVDKCKTFGVAKLGSTAKQIYPKLFVNGEIISALKDNESFKYLGRYYNFDMSNENHKKILIEEVEDILSIIAKLPLHPKHKLDLYNRYLLSKISWHLTIADLTETWVKEVLDNKCHNAFRPWLEIPANGTVDIIMLSKSKFGLNIVDVSMKFTQCQTIIRKKLSNAENEDTQLIYQLIREKSNINYDHFITSKNVIKDLRERKQEHITRNLTTQNLVVKALWQESFTGNVKTWNTALNKLPKNIYNFTQRYLNNTLPTLKNMCRWKKKDNSLCFSCLQPQTLQHVVSGCKIHLKEGRYNWRHDSILKTLADFIISVNKQVEIYVDLDLPGYRSPCIVTGESERPDIVITLKDKIYIIELTVGFETRIKDNAHRKKEKYLNLCRRLTMDREVTFINLTMGAIGIIGKDGKGLYKMLKNLELSSQEISFITNKITGHCIRSTYYLFCMKDKPWENPELLTW